MSRLVLVAALAYTGVPRSLQRHEYRIVTSTMEASTFKAEDKKVEIPQLCKSADDGSGKVFVVWHISRHR